MNTIQLRLSSKAEKNTGKSEILMRISMRTKDGFKTLRAKSGVFIYPKHFQYYIDRKSSEKLGIKIPVKMITVDHDEAIKKGYPIFDKGEIVINEKVKTPEVNEDMKSNETLKDLMKLVSDAINSQASTTSEDLKTIIDTFHHPDKFQQREDKNIYELMTIFLQKKNYNYASEKGYKVLMRTLWRFEAFKRLTEDSSYTFSYDTVTRYDIEDFEDYIINEHDLSIEFPDTFSKIFNHYPEYIPSSARAKRNVIEERGGNCIIKMKKNLKTFFNWLYETERTTNRPFEGVKIGAEKYGTPYYITTEERNIIANYDLSDNPSLETQRDIFVFQCLTGCRVGDLMKLTIDNVTKGILEYIPNKTKDEKDQVKPRVPLNQKALDLIKKYKGKDPEGRLFPFISSQKYNKAIKKFFEICGITRNVSVRNPTTGETEIRPINEVASSHMARRTFIGATYKVVKDPNLIGKMSGHVEGSKAFVRYRDIDDDMLKEVISKI